MVLDYSILPFTVTIGDLDITNCLTKFDISRPVPEQGNILSWTGNFEIGFNEASEITEDQLDPITNPGYFRPYQKQCVFSILGFIVCRFYIQTYTYDRQEHKGQGNIYQILDIASGDTPSEELQLTLTNQGNALGDIIEFCLNKAFTDASITAPTLVFDKSKHTGRYYNRLTSQDFIKEAADFAFKNYYWLYVDNLNQIDQVSGDPEKSSNLIIRPLDQVEIKPIFDNINFASDKVIVTGSREYSDVLFSFGITFSVLDPPDDGTQSFNESGKQLQLITNTYKKRYQLYPDSFTETITEPSGKIRLQILDTSDSLYEKKRVEYKYWGINPPYHPIDTLFSEPSIDQKYLPQVTDFANQFKKGDLVQTITTTERVASSVFPEYDDEGKVVVNDALVFYEKLVETDWCKVRYLAKGLVDQELIEQKGGVVFDTSPMLVSSEPIKNGRINPNGQITEPVKGKPEDNEDNPGSFLKLEVEEQPEDRQPEPELDLKEETLTGTANFQPVGWTPFRKKPFTIEVGFIPDQEHADYLALQLGKREIRRRDAVHITMPVPLEYLQSGCIPLQKARIHNLDLFITEEIISIDEGKMQFAFTGELIGLIDPIAATPEPSPFIPGQVLYLLNQNHFLIESQAVTTQLEVLGGTSPYSFAYTTLPSGLTLSSSGLLSGTPTTPVNSSHLIIITDSSSHTLSVNLNFSIAPNTPSTALDIVKSDLLDLLSITAESIYRFGLASGLTLSETIFEPLQILDTAYAIDSIQTLTNTVNTASATGLSVPIIQLTGEALNNRLRLNSNITQYNPQITNDSINNTLKLGDAQTFVGYLIDSDGLNNQLKQGSGTTQYNPIITGETLNNQLLVGSGTIPSYYSQTTALLARLTGSYSSADKDAIDTFIRGLVDNSIWNKLDCIYMFAAPIKSDALLNWKGNTYNCTETGTVSFTANQGVIYTTSSNYLRTGFIPSTAGGNYTQNSASMGVYSRTNAQSNSYIMGATGGNSIFILRATSNSMGAYVNNSTQFFSAGSSVTSSTRLFIATRTNSTTATLYRDGVNLVSNSTASSGVPAIQIYILGYNSSGTYIDGSPHQLSFAFIGGGLSATEVTTLTNLLTDYLTYKGANV